MRLHGMWISCAALAASAWAVPAWSQQERTREENFRAWDRNGDGRLQEREFPGHEGNFQAMDCDGDGSLSRYEFVHRYDCPGGRAPAAARADDRAVRLRDGYVRGRDMRFDALDRDGDGILTRREWSADARSFDRADRNDDRVVTWDEYRDDLRGPRSSWVWPDEQRLRELDLNRDGRLGRSELRNDAIFELLDRNRDGWVTRAEVRDRRALADRFRELDRDRDGSLSEWEWRRDRDFFAYLDRNGDGRVSRSEFLSFADGRYSSR